MSPVAFLAPEHCGAGGDVGQGLPLGGQSTPIPGPRRVYPQEVPRPFEETVPGWLHCPGEWRVVGACSAHTCRPPSLCTSYFAGATAARLSV